MPKTPFYIPLIIFCLVLLIAQNGSPAQKEEITAAIQKQYQSIESFRTEVTQKLINKNSNYSEVREGRIVYKRPRRVYWETVSPEKEVLIMNREFVWEYFPVEGVAYRYSLRQMFDSQTMLRFISGEVNLQEEFHVSRIDPDAKDKDLIRLKLIPKDPDSSLLEAEIRVDPEDMLIRRIELSHFSQSNILRFRDIKVNCQPQDDLFEFEPPEDTRVVDKTTE